MTSSIQRHKRSNGCWLYQNNKHQIIKNLNKNTKNLWRMNDTVRCGWRSIPSGCNLICFRCFLLQTLLVIEQRNLVILLNIWIISHIYLLRYTKTYGSKTTNRQLQNIKSILLALLLSVFAWLQAFLRMKAPTASSVS